MAGIYLHIPFCKRKCIYCDFYSTAQFGLYGGKFLEAAFREVRTQRGFLADPVDTVYFGGGTPSLYAPSDIRYLLETVSDNFNTSRLSEVTLEANPEDLSPPYLNALAAAGINRLSIGVQSFDDGLLTFMRRRHDAARAAEAVRHARSAGFGNISIDLIYGIPGMTAGIWEETLREAVALRPEHISAYHLTFESGTTLGKWKEKKKISEVPDEESREQFLALHHTLTEAEYEHYEVSNFALPGYRSRHNSSYWTGEPYLGIGPGAHSYDGTVRRLCDMTVKDYVAAAEPVYGREQLTSDDRYNEIVMTSLRTSDGLHLSRIRNKVGDCFSELFIETARPLVERGHLRQNGERYWIEPADFLTSDSVIAYLFV
ncbi:MAG: radical SAM family heme chaperone HemW [Rikenellaceae bacterium]|nr:radical SAM family heme chaperone HemW [Rikenellaceae bacterium]